MELNKMEVAVVEEVVSKVAGGDLRELNDLQLAFVGGGIGDTAV